MNFDDNDNSSLADGQEVLESGNNADIKDNLDIDLNNSTDGKFIDDKENLSDNETSSNEVDEKALYDEILEKLDIKSKEKSSSNKENLKTQKLKEVLNKLQSAKDKQVKTQMRASMNKDFEKIQKLIQTGLIDSAQGQNLKKQVLKKTFDKIVQAGKSQKSLSDILKNKNLSNLNKQKSFDEIGVNNSDFFNSNGRKEVLDYLKSGKIPVGGEEINKISEIVKLVEKSAIERYLQKAAHEKTLLNSNENAKQRLTANAQKSSRSESFSKTFTREQIGKMSSAEFTKYEPYIMEQLKKGQIK